MCVNFVRALCRADTCEALYRAVLAFRGRSEEAVGTVPLLPVYIMFVNKCRGCYLHTRELKILKTLLKSAKFPKIYEQNVIAG